MACLACSVARAQAARANLASGRLVLSALTTCPYSYVLSVCILYGLFVAKDVTHRTFHAINVQIHAPVSLHQMGETDQPGGGAGGGLGVRNVRFWDVHYVT